MRRLLAVGTLVAFLKSEVSFQSYPAVCAESIVLISITIRSIDSSRPCGSNAGKFIEFALLIVEIYYEQSRGQLILFSLSPSLGCVLDRRGTYTPIIIYNPHNESAPLYHYPF
eukprot:scaffold23096_cov32-Attheya_sp.AAC.1